MNRTIDAWFNPRSMLMSRRHFPGAIRRRVLSASLFRSEALANADHGLEGFVMGSSRHTSYRELWNG